jgi:hypothetical protein
VADLTDIQAAQSVKIIGADSAGLETNPVNAYLDGSLQNRHANTYASAVFNTGGSPANLTIDCTGLGNVRLDISGTWTGSITWLGSLDGINFNVITNATNIVTLDGNVPVQANTNGVWDFPVSGFNFLRLTNVVLTGSANVRMGGGPAGMVISAILANTFVAQTGTWDINNITGIISLPTGASTSSLQTTINNSINALQVAQGSATAGEKGSLMLGAVTTNAPSYTTGQSSPFSLDTSGLLRVSLKDTPSNTNKFLVTADPITFASPQHTIVDSGSIGVTNLPATVDTNYGTVGASTIRTAAQIGNATGAANFNYGTVGAQTLRVASQVGNATGAADFNYGTVGAQTLRTASQIGNATGAALFGAGTTTAQVLRVVLPTDQTVIPVQGQKTNNNAAPGATNVGTLPALANAAAPSWTEGNQVALSVDLAGNARTIDIADGPVTPGTAATKSTLTGGQFNTALPTLTNTQQAATQMDANGRTIVLSVPTFGIQKTYSAAVLITTAALSTDILSIIGSSTKTIAITNFVISGIATTATVATVNIIKRSTADTLGTPTTVTAVPNDSSNAAATAVVTSYAGVPTTGTLVGNLKTFKVFFPLASGGSAGTPSAPQYSPATITQPIVLRGVAETLAINLGGITLPGGVVAVSIEWTEF